MWSDAVVWIVVIVVSLLLASSYFLFVAVRNAWQMLTALRRGRLRNTIVTVPDGPHGGELGHAMACGAHLAVAAGIAWNSLSDTAEERDQTVTDLHDVWAVDSPQAWRRVMAVLLDPDEGVGGMAEAVLVVRRQWHAVRGVYPDHETWRQLIVHVGRANEASETDIGDWLALAETTVVCEARLHDDGLLAADERVTTVRAYDIGRAINLARWATVAGLCDVREAREQVVRAGRLARDRYTSWRRFSAGYVLGRLLSFDHGNFGDFYHTVLRAHRVLATDPASPWRTIDWRFPGATRDER